MKTRLLVAALGSLVTLACGIGTARVDGTPQQGELAACATGPVSALCDCGGPASTGYCCAGVHQAGACTTTPVCGEGAISATCTCGGTPYATGYCCAGVHQAGACTTTPACGQGAVVSTCTCGAATVSTGFCCGGLPQSAACTAALVVDHRAAAAFSRIPPQWLTAARALTLHYAHTSHGSQILTGLAQLQRRDAQYAYAVREAVTEGLPTATGALRVYDGNGNGSTTYITPDLYWDGTAGLGATRSVAATGRYDYSGWAWCGQQSTNDTATVDRYLSTMSGLETQFPSMRFILFTGHTDGSNTPSTPGTLKYNNARVRAYAQSHGMVLYDFEDIESWDPGGTYYPTTTDACEWCSSWCTAHPADCADFGSMGGCAHSHQLNCIQKAKAFWWMMARLAGWDGN